MSFRYNLPYSVTLGPQRHSFFRYPPVAIRPLGSLPPSQPTTFDTVLRWGFWMGVGFAAVQVFQKLTQKPAWEMNARKSKAETEALKARVLELYVPGEPVRPLARELGIPVATIRKWLKKAGIYDPAPTGRYRDEERYQKVLERYVPGEQVRPLARELGIPVATIMRWLKEAGVYEPASTKGSHRDEQLYQEVLRRYVPGEPVGPLAEDLGVHLDTVLKWLKDDGVYESAISRDERRYQEALRRYVPGEPVIPFAEDLGVHVTTVMRWLKDAGVYVPATKGRKVKEQLKREALRRYVPGEPVAPLARELGVTPSTIVRWLKDAVVYVPAPRGRRKKR